MKNLILKNRFVLLYGFTLAILVLLLKWLQWKFVITDITVEVYAALIAVFFTLLGVWIATQLIKPKVETIVVEKEIYVPAPSELTVNTKELEKLNLSTREYEVLQLLVIGHSNADIAAALYLSLSTIKTHVSNIFLKMDVKSRTQAIERARRLKIIE
ncbi:helix-turn-helix transcriptional regulator [Gynurincola endophyticus]|uniref:helix-turn-helix transcriptional regulator n=1 Tax=Gynurincola endophyticus TaxID=2479004 RepID=UPI000F8EFA55|nr:response regulator transcription factor [Gynurincola endophyticus]